MDFLDIVNEKMNDIEYGWIDKDGNRHKKIDGFGEEYILQMPDQLLKSKLGVCWDQVELERKLFAEKKIKTNTYFIVHYDGDKCPTHTFILFEHNKKTYWHEHSWSPMRGVHEYENEGDALKDVRAKFIDGELQGKFNPNNLIIYKYSAPNKNLSCPEFYAHCEKGVVIEL